MSRITELFEELAESVSVPRDNTRATFRKFLDNFANQQQFQSDRKLAELQATGEYLRSPEGERASSIALGGLAALAPIPGAKARFAGQVSKPLINKMHGAVGDDISKMFIPPLSKLGRRFRNQATPPSSGARVGQDARREGMSKLFIPPLTKIGQRTTNRGPRGNTNIDAPVQRNLDLSDLKPTGIQNTTQARGMNPKMRESLTTRRDNIQQDIFKMEGQNSLNEVVDMQKLFRLQDELKALNKTLLD